MRKAEFGYTTAGDGTRVFDIRAVADGQALGLEQRAFTSVLLLTSKSDLS